MLQPERSTLLKYYYTTFANNIQLLLPQKSDKTAVKNRKQAVKCVKCVGTRFVIVYRRTTAPITSINQELSPAARVDITSTSS